MPEKENKSPDQKVMTESDELTQVNRPNVQILYEDTGALFANQVIVNAGRDQIVMDFSTGIISDHATQRHILPIQRRIAMTPANALKLIQTLSGVIQQQVEASQAPATDQES